MKPSAQRRSDQLYRHAIDVLLAQFNILAYWICISTSWILFSNFLTDLFLHSNFLAEPCFSWNFPGAVHPALPVFWSPVGPNIFLIQSSVGRNLPPIQHSVGHTLSLKQCSVGYTLYFIPVLVGKWISDSTKQLWKFVHLKSYFVFDKTPCRIVGQPPQKENR